MSSTMVSRILYTLALSVGSATAADTFTSFDYPSATSTQPFGVNADGAVVGVYVDSAGTHGFLLREGRFTSIEYPGAVYTSALGINSQGDIVGCHIEDPTRIPGTIGCHGYVLRQGVFTSIDVPGKYGAIAAHINDAGQIVGCAHDDDGPGGTMIGQGKNAIKVLFLNPRGDVSFWNGFMTVVPMVFGSALCMIAGSLLTRPPCQATIDKYFSTPKLQPASAEVAA